MSIRQGYGKSEYNLHMARRLQIWSIERAKKIENPLSGCAGTKTRWRCPIAACWSGKERPDNRPVALKKRSGNQGPA